MSSFSLSYAMVEENQLRSLLSTVVSKEAKDVGRERMADQLHVFLSFFNYYFCSSTDLAL